MQQYGLHDDQMKSLRNGRHSHLGQIENDFKDPKDGFWKTKISIVRNSEVY